MRCLLLHCDLLHLIKQSYLISNLVFSWAYQSSHAWFDLSSWLDAGIGSGGSFASAAARALIDLPDWDAEAIGECCWVLGRLTVFTASSIWFEDVFIRILCNLFSTN